MPNQAVKLTISGEVQGVGFRSGVAREARQRGLVGYASNRPGGVVEVYAEGELEELKSFIDWCYTGVRRASVDMIDVSWEKPTGEHFNFVIQS